MRVATQAVLVNAGIIIGLVLSLLRGAKPLVTMLVGVALLLLANAILILKNRARRSSR